MVRIFLAAVQAHFNLMCMIFLLLLCWMILKMLDEKYARNQILLQPDFSSSNMISLFFLLFSRSIKSIQHFIEYDIFVMLDEMLDWFNKAFRKFLNIHRKKKYATKSLFK